MRFKQKTQEDVHIDLTPFIDVVLMLLLFFVVTTSFTKKTNSLGIQLPKAEGQAKLLEEALLEIGVDAKGEYAVNGVVVGHDLERLKRILREKWAKGATPVYILGDGQAPHQAIVSVLEIAAQMGVQDVQILATSKRA